MLRITFGVIAVLMFAVAAVSAEEEVVEVRRVLVLDKSLKPAAAAAQPKYEYVRVKTPEGKPNPELMCDACCKKEGKEYVSKPALQGKTVAYLCASCGEMCYRENGVEMKYTEEKEVKALKEIATELGKPIDRSQKPSVQTLQKMGR